jgi:hypothetical protein
MYLSRWEVAKARAEADVQLCALLVLHEIGNHKYFALAASCSGAARVRVNRCM